MANLKISQLTSGNPAQSGDVIPIDRAGANFSITAGSIAALATAPVTSVFTRTGAVTAQTGDYTAAQVGAIALSLMTTLGDTIYESAAPAPTRLAGNTTATKMYLSQTGNGSISAAPAWAQINYADITGTTPTPPSGAVLWSALGNAGGNLTLANAGNTTTFNQTSAVAWLWANTTAATNSTTNASPLHEFAANYNSGSAGSPVSSQDLWTIGSSLAAGPNGISLLTFAHAGSTGHAGLEAPGIGNGTSNLQLVSPLSGNYGNAYVIGGSAIIVATQFSAGSSPGAGATGGYYGGFSVWSDSSAYVIGVLASSHYAGIGSACMIRFSSTTAYSGTADVGISRSAAGVLAIGNGTAGDVSGKLTLAQLILSATQSPASNAAGTAGELAYDGSYIYVCISSGVWTRAALTGGY